MVSKTPAILAILLISLSTIVMAEGITVQDKPAQDRTAEEQQTVNDTSAQQVQTKKHPLEGNFDITFAGWSEHLTSTGRNQDNYIFGLRYKNLEAFTLHNSFETRSYILAYHAQLDWKSWVKVGVRVGGITGYTKEENAVQAGGVTPLFAPTLTLHYQKLGFETALFTDVIIFSMKLML
ncbi:hypothetical protein LNL84_04660 [Vibrio sp. ZSDZ34]|uniref:Uncharacterized protein n=1 Tax=Vibrio gelatinilyticus TaxID=2893468 RepID=A0A9X2AV87_9VIBR|nr:hypothetical protein [Vibrio gelatinilyticus]MCJ2376120.1 hypothetical protein [Vibrio gelatinilyticus]